MLACSVLKGNLARCGRRRDSWRQKKACTGDQRDGKAINRPRPWRRENGKRVGSKTGRSEHGGVTHIPGGSSTAHWQSELAKRWAMGGLAHREQRKRKQDGAKQQTDNASSRASIATKRSERKDAGEAFGKPLTGTCSIRFPMDYASFPSRENKPALSLNCCTQTSMLALAFSLLIGRASGPAPPISPGLIEEPHASGSFRTASRPTSPPTPAPPRLEPQQQSASRMPRRPSMSCEQLRRVS